MAEPDDVLDDFHFAVMRIKELEQQNADLVAALEDSCAWHHTPLINGWVHKTELGKTIKCRLSQKARQALAQVGE